MGRNGRKGRNLRRDEQKLDAEVLTAIRRFVKRQRKKGIKVQYLNFLWDGEHYPRLSTEYGLNNGLPIALPPMARSEPENDTTPEATSGIFPVAHPAEPAWREVSGEYKQNVPTVIHANHVGIIVL